MALNAGHLNRRIVVQARTQAIGSDGERTDTWTEYTTVWAKVEPLTGRSFYQADSEITKHMVLFNIRYSATTKLIDADGYRVVFDGNSYDIESAVEIDAARDEIQIRGVRRD